MPSVWEVIKSMVQKPHELGKSGRFGSQTLMLSCFHIFPNDREIWKGPQICIAHGS